MRPELILVRQIVFLGCYALLLTVEGMVELGIHINARSTGKFEFSALERASGYGWDARGQKYYCVLLLELGADPCSTTATSDIPYKASAVKRFTKEVMPNGKEVHPGDSAHIKRLRELLSKHDCEPESDRN